MEHPSHLVDEYSQKYRQVQFQGVTVFQHLVPQAELVSIQDLCASAHGFAALRADGRVCHWGLEAKEDPRMVPKGELQGEIGLWGIVLGGTRSRKLRLVLKHMELMSGRSRSK